MKKLTRLLLVSFTITLFNAGCGNNAGNQAAETNDSVLMDTTMTTGTGSDTLDTPAATGVDNTRNPIPPQSNQ